jgi:hypothetical protein
MTAPIATDIRAHSGHLSRRHSFAARADDAYMTPAVATEALLRHVEFPIHLWEPACGDGTGILDVIRARGHRVIGSDLVDCGRPDCFWRRDFLMESKAPDGCEAIVTNPPYKLAEPFIEHALDLCPRVIMLLRLAFLESERRTHILEHCGLERVLCFRQRLPMMHRQNWQGRRASSSIAFAWFIWNAGHRGPTELHRISWDAAP